MIFGRNIQKETAVFRGDRNTKIAKEETISVKKQEQIGYNLITTTLFGGLRKNAGTTVCGSEKRCFYLEMCDFVDEKIDR